MNKKKIKILKFYDTSCHDMTLTLYLREYQTADKTFILQDFRIHWLGTDRRAHGGGGICKFDDIVVIILGQVRLILAILAGSGRSAELTW